jgi:hypothetical protein
LNEGDALDLAFRTNTTRRASFEYVELRLNPRPTYRIRITPIALLIVAVLTIVGTITFTTTASVASAAVNSDSIPDLSNFACSLPVLTRGVKESPHSSKLSGPAVTALTGHAVRHGFSLDGGDFVVQPPQRGDVPRLDAHQATCGAMASTGAMGPSAAQGVAVGFGRVSIAAKFFPAITGIPSAGDIASKYPKVSSFHNQLAWLVAVRTNPPVFNCPDESVPVRLVPRPSDHGYEIFVIDARKGTNALVYREGGPGGCKSGARVPPSVGVAEESVSVPWTLTSRDPHDYSGTIAARVLPCDQAPGNVMVNEGAPVVEVQVARPFGPACRPPESIPISLGAATVTSDLPTNITHFPVGLLTGLSLHPTSPGRTSPSVTMTTSTALVPVDETKNDQTLQVSVGQVLTLLPLLGTLGTSFTSPAVSSDPAVLGPLTSSPQPLVAEFRAWKKGTADITVPQSACIHPGSDQPPCSGAFVVHVVVK